MELSKAELGQADRFERLDTLMSENGYPGRWLAMGRVEDGVDRLFPGSLALAYSFGGRSDGSKDRVAVQDNDAIRLYSPALVWAVKPLPLAISSNSFGVLPVFSSMLSRYA